MFFGAPFLRKSIEVQGPFEQYTLKGFLLLCVFELDFLFFLFSLLFFVLFFLFRQETMR